MSWKVTKEYRELLVSERELSPAPKGGRLSFLLASPKSYYLGMSNLGAQIIYRTLKQNRIYCERSFVPDPDEERELRIREKPLYSLESQRPVQEFDIIGFSISYEFEFLGVVKTLDLARIPLYSHDREWPLVVAGGAITATNPEPLAPFIDVFVVGEGEEAILELINCYEEHAPLGKRALLEALAGRRGFYVPAFYRPHYGEDGRFQEIEPLEPDLPLPIERRTIPNLDSFPGHTEILTPHTEFSNMHLLELARGCAYRCHFCMVTSSYGPYRIRSLERVLEEARLGLKHTKRIGLMGATIGNYKHIREICREMTRQKVELSVSSLRADTMPAELVEALAVAGKRAVTIAPEVGRESLRWALNKKMKDSEVYEAAEMVSKAGLSRLKLYFMVGVPGERDDDLDALLEMVRTIRGIQRRALGKRGTAVVSVNPFVPKPFTEFERRPMAPEPELRRVLHRLGRELARDPGIKYTHEQPRWSMLQGVLARGDRRLAPVLVELSRRGTTSFGAWETALIRHGLSVGQFIARELDAPELPWRHLAVTPASQRGLAEVIP